MPSKSSQSALSSPVLASIAAMSGRFLLLGTGALTGVLIPLSMSQKSVGLFFLAQSLIAALATIGQLGLSITAPALISSSLGHNDPGRVRLTIRRSLTLGCLASIALAVLFCGAMFYIDRTHDSEVFRSLYPLSSTIAVSLVFSALATVLTEQHRAVGHFVQASFLATGASLASAATVIVAWATHSPLPLQSLLVAGAAGSVAGALVGGLSIWRWYRRDHQPAREPFGYLALLAQTRPNLTTTIVLFIVAQADLWIIAAFGDTSGLAIYGLASRLAGLILIPLAVVNTVIAPSIGRLWARRKTRYLQKVLGIGAGAATALAIVGYVIFLLCGKFILVHVWSTEYEDAYYVFLLLGASQIVQTYAGTAGFVLMMLGRQQIAMRISVGSGVVMIAAGAWAMGRFGIIGLAAAYSAGGIIQSALMIQQVKSHFNLKTTANYRSLATFLRRYLHKRT